MTSPYFGFTLADVRRLEAEAPVATLEYHETLDSTNDRALALAREQKVVLPAMVLTAEQTAGRGRGRNQWSSSAGSLTFSLIIEPPGGLPIERLPSLSLAAALAVCDTLEHSLPAAHGIGLKWPNDVFLDGGKVCGILTESVAAPERRVVIGIGLNVNNDLEGVPSATSLAEAAGKSLPLTDTLLSLLNKLNQRIASANAWLAGCDRYCMLTGRVVHVTTPQAFITGQCLGIARNGALLIKDQHATHSIHSGTVTEIE